MIKNTYRKILIISFIIIFLIISIMTIVIAENVIHNEHCSIKNCCLCNLIEISSEFIKNITLINIDILTLAAIVPLMQLINGNIQKERKLTLVELKVIQNK